MKRTFDAPWSTSLKLVSLLSTMVLLAIALWIPAPRDPDWLSPLLRTLPLVLIAGCALFTVRSYEVSGGRLHVRRLIWVTRIPLQTLTGAEWRPGSFGWAARTCGNGGLFSFTGWYYQKSIGPFRALATRTTDAVIFKFTDRKPIVITPDDPAALVEAVKLERAPTAASVAS